MLVLTIPSNLMKKSLITAVSWAHAICMSLARIKKAEYAFTIDASKPNARASRRM